MAALATIVSVCGAAKATPPLAAYGRLPALEMVTLSPSGDKIAFVAVDGEARRLFVRRVGGDAILADGVGNSKIRDLAFAGDDHLLIFATHTYKFGNHAIDKWSYSTRAELGVLLTVNLKTRAIQRVFDHQEDAVLLGAIDRLYGAREIDGRWYAFIRAQQTNFEGRRIYKVDLDTGKYTIINPIKGDDYDYLIGQDGEIAATTRYDWVSNTWNLYAGAEGEQAVVKRASPLGAAGLDGPGRTPGTVLVTDTIAHQNTVDEYPTRPGATPVRLFQGIEVDEMLRDPSSDLLLGALTDHGQHAVLFDPKLQRRFDAAAKAFPGYRFHLMSFTTDMSRMVVLADGGDDSGTYWLVDMTTGKAAELMGRYPDIGPKDVGPTRVFKYKASDGTPHEAILTLPPGSAGKALPLVVMPHGGPIGVDDTIGFDWWAQAFASRGYAVLQPNYRGSSGRGVAFQESGLGEWGRKILTDISDGAAALEAAGIADPDRVCIVGASYGGYAALAGVTIQQGLYRCAVSVSGVSDVGAIMKRDGYSDGSPTGRYNQRLFGVKWAADDSLRQISPLRSAAEADAPILLIHGKDDTRVPFVHSQSMATALEKAGKRFRFVPTEGEDHFLSRAATRTQTLEESVAWVETYNPAAASSGLRQAGAGAPPAPTAAAAATAARP